LVHLLLLGAVAGCAGNPQPLQQTSAEEVRRLNTEGVRLLSRGNLKRANARFLRALDLSRATDDLEGKAASFYNLAILERSQGHLEQALEKLAQSVALFRKVGLADETARSLTAQGTIYLLQGRTREARESLSQALAEAPPGVTAEVLVALSILYLREGQTDAAREAAAKGLLLATNERVRADALFGMARIEAYTGNRNGAQRLLLEVLAIDRERDRRPQLALTLSFLGELAKAQGQYKEASQYFERASEVYEGLGMTGEAQTAQEAARRALRGSSS
jgi:tetratricopeptide (TPR) repeat protein